ncbi:MAG: ThiF family adenylyltransferase [Holophagales bacterium]|nr:ThiF family adenylyltransferase [Holophagales bacterium]MYC12014.1 ThiF family adenylyltransferase [Holophagales bacterium]
MTFEAALVEPVHETACDHLLNHLRSGKRQEDLCFALWHPSRGAARTTALVSELLLPEDGERTLHGNASFEADYVSRAVRLAAEKNAGLALMHSHPASGWQGMSREDVEAERDRLSGPARATGLPFVGLTLGTDGAWSARFWTWTGDKFERRWCQKVRVVGHRLRLTYHDRMAPPPRRRPALRRTIDTWGAACQADLARLRIGVVGLGSVGCIVAETLARIGIEQIVLIDADRVEAHNLDRLLYAGEEDVGRLKVELAADQLRRSATASAIRVDAHAGWLQQETCFRAALDCDVLFSCVDRPLPKDVMNHIAYAHCIPVVFGGVYIDTKGDGTLGQAAWSVVHVGPEHRCLRCDGQYTTSDVVLERDGSLDDPSYIASVTGSRPRNQNVFPFSANLASLMTLEMLRMVLGADWWPKGAGRLHYSYLPGRLNAVDERCRAHCEVRARTALGDRVAYPFLEAEPQPAGTSPASPDPRVPARLVRWLQELMRGGKP